MAGMREIETKELRKIQLGILDSIASFCEANNLRYFLGYGTLIGAIRHKGFIPWDDDIDLVMPRPDYEIFCKTYKDCNNNYKVKYTGNDNSCYINFAKVHDTRTRFQESYSIENNYGIFVDIFPLDGYGSRGQAIKCYGIFRAIHYKSLAVNKSNPILKNIAITGIKLLLKPVSLTFLAKELEKVSRKYPIDGSEYVYFFSEKTPPFKKELFSKHIYQEFEGNRYRIPVGFDELLRQQYGDYMQLPPEKERINKHHARAWWK